MVDNVARELAARLDINRQKEWVEQILDSSKRIADTANLNIKSETERLHVKDLMVQLREKTEALEATFDKIDQIEAIVHTVKETYNKVAASVDDMEKAVMASTSSGFNLFQL
ncbi:hypothetical protein BX666DRAFT_1873465 [Dichotomocladium elegans]|nr:hypothetical protein BX666DRAFT_1873465 [Dichotomocladium elegans]